MRLYPKQLNSIEQLKREKAALKLLRDKANVEDIFSLNDLIPGRKDTKERKKKEDKEEEDASEADGIMGMLNGLMENVDIAEVFKMASVPLGMFAGKKLRSNVIMPVAKELLGGYLKWKAAELAFKAAKHFVQKRKEDRRKEKEKKKD